MIAEKTRLDKYAIYRILTDVLQMPKIEQTKQNEKVDSFPRFIVKT